MKGASYKVNYNRRDTIPKEVIEFAIKHDNNSAAARKYGTSRQNVKRWRDRFGGTRDSIRNKSRRRHAHPNQHTSEELLLIKKKYQRYVMKAWLKFIFNVSVATTQCASKYAIKVGIVRIPHPLKLIQNQGGNQLLLIT